MTSHPKRNVGKPAIGLLDIIGAYASIVLGIVLVYTSFAALYVHGEPIIYLEALIGAGLITLGPLEVYRRIQLCKKSD